MQFNYAAYSPEQGILKGQLEASDPKEVAQTLGHQGLKLLKVRGARHLPGMEQLFPSFYKVGSGELVKFCRQVATMVASGGSLLRALEMVEVESKNRFMRRTISEMRRTLSDGDSLTAAMSAHPKVFPQLFISVVEVGEFTGRLAPSLEQLAAMMESEQEAKQRAIRTMMYPMAIMGLSVVTLGVLITVAVPPLLKVFEQMGADTPAMTKFAVWLVDFFTVNGLKIFTVLAALLVSYSVIKRTAGGRRRIDGFMAKLPFWGPLTVAGDLARISSTMAMLLGSGVPLSTALNLGITGCKNIRIREAFEGAEESLVSGHGLSEGLRQHSVLPTLFIELMVMGEETNSLPRMMADSADAYQRQRGQRLNALLGILEPASTLIVGGIVGFIAFSMFVPIYSGLEALG